MRLSVVQSSRSMPKSSAKESVVTPAQVAAYRLKRHHLLDDTPADPVTICRDVCGIQAQVTSAAYLQFWSRNHAITRADIEDAICNSRTLVKTSLMRQTLHLVPSDEFFLYIAALKTRLVARARHIMSKFGIGQEEGDAVTALIMESLSSGPLARPVILSMLRPKVSQRVRNWMAKVWSILRIPIAEGLICYGPGEGNQVSYIRVADWLPKAKPIPEAKAQVALLRKYLHAYGPATVHDFVHWSGIPMAVSRRTYASLENELQEVTVSGETCSTLRVDLAELRSPAAARGEVRLLPLFDPFLLAHAEKHHLVETLHYKRVYRNQGWISAVILLDGKIVGTWSYRTERKLILEIEPFAKLKASVLKRVKEEAKSVAAFFARESEIQCITLEKSGGVIRAKGTVR